MDIGTLVVPFIPFHPLHTLYACFRVFLFFLNYYHARKNLKIQKPENKKKLIVVLSEECVIGLKHFITILKFKAF